MSYFNNLRKVIANQSDIPTNGLVSHWKLNEDPAIHGTTIVDSFGSNDGTLITNNGSTNKSVVGQVAKAIDLDGTDDYIDCGNAFPSTDFTVTIWVETTDLSTNNDVAFSGGSGSPDSSIMILYANTTFGTANNQIRVFGLGGEICVGSDIRNTGWRHLSVTRDGDSFTLYVDGVFDGSGTGSGTTESLFYLGRYLSRYINASLDDVYLYNRALSGDEILTIYNETA